MAMDKRRLRGLVTRVRITLDRSRPNAKQEAEEITKFERKCT